MILLVHEDTAILQKYKKQLETRHFNVIAVMSSQEAMTRFFTHQDMISTVITNYDMPDINGLELLQSIRQSYPSICAILIADGLIKEKLPRNIQFYNNPVPFDDLIANLNDELKPLR